MPVPHRSAFSRRSFPGAGVAGPILVDHPPSRLRAQSASPVATPIVDPAQLTETVTSAIERHHLMAALARVVVDGEVLVTVAAGESLPGVPATPEMRFRSGSVAIAWMATALLRLVEAGEVTLATPVSDFLPDLPNSELATLEMLANMTAGYTDYVTVPKFGERFYADPLQHWEPEELIALGLEQVTGQPLATTLRALVLDPLGLHDTLSDDTAALPDPVLHAYTAERRGPLRIPAGVPFLEASTYWDPSWTLVRGSVQSTTIADLAASAIGFGEGTLLSPAMHERQVAKSLIGFGRPLDGCLTCRQMDEQLTFGLGVLLTGDWIAQNPSFGGYAGTAAYLPGRKLAIATAVTLTAGAFDPEGNLRIPNASTTLATELSVLLAPESPLRGHRSPDAPAPLPRPGGSGSPAGHADAGPALNWPGSRPRAARKARTPGRRGMPSRPPRRVHLRAAVAAANSAICGNGQPCSTPNRYAP